MQEKQKLRILVADDEPPLRLLYKSELEAEGYEVVLAEDGKEAVRMVDEGDLDLVVLDIRMPGLDGIEALGRILDRKRTLPVIINTAYATERNNFMTWSADAYVVKSSDLTELKTKIREVLRSRAGERRSGSDA